MKLYFSFLLVFAFLFSSSQEIKDKETFKKCRKEFNKKTCLADDDEDGVLNYLDGCKNVAGPVENNGCPFPDSDGDGVADNDDACLLVVGPYENQGCPWQDTDGDGILDKDDKCPTVVGIIEKEGCPEKDCTKFYEEEQERLKKFQEEAKNVNYKSLIPKIINGIELKYLKEKYVIIILEDIIAICGNENSCYHTYNYDAPLFSNSNFWDDKTIKNVFLKLNKNVIFCNRTMGMGFDMEFLYYPSSNIKISNVEFDYKEREFHAPLFSKYENKLKVLKNYDLFYIDISNSLGNIVSVVYSYEYFMEKKRQDGFVYKELHNKNVLKKFKYIDNDWKLIETKSEN